MQLDQLSNFISQPMAEFWNEYGLQLTGFYITSIDVDTTSKDGRKIAEALSDRSAQNIAGYTWQQRQSFDMANNAVSGLGSSKSGMGGLVGMAMMGGMFSGGGMGQPMMQVPSQTGYGAGPGIGQQAASQAGYGGGAQPRRQVFCANCAKPYDATSRFCPNCGHEYNPCPICGSDNQQGAHRCVSCGAELPSHNVVYADVSCPRCRAMVKPGTRFCPQCGMRLQ